MPTLVLHRDQRFFPAPGVSGMGDTWGGAVASMIAGKELNQLISAISRVQDQLRSTIEVRNGIFNGYVEAKKLLDQARSAYGPDFMPGPFGAMMPNFRSLPAMMAYGSAVKGVQQLARQIKTFEIFDIVFRSVAGALHKAGLMNDADSVDQTTRQLMRFDIETDSKFANVPEYTSTKTKLLDAFVAELAAWGVSRNAYDDPRYFQAFIKSADRIVPIPGRPNPPAGSGLGNPLPVVVVAIIWIVGVVAAALVVMSTINRIIPDQNSKAIAARDTVLQRERDWTKIQSDMISKGASQAQIDTARKSWESGTKAAVETIPEPKSPLGGLILPALIVGGILVTIPIVTGMVTKK
jgi:hypothetical protein